MDYHGFIARKTQLFRPFLDVHQLVSHFSHPANRYANNRWPGDCILPKKNLPVDLILSHRIRIVIVYGLWARRLKGTLRSIHWKWWISLGIQGVFFSPTRGRCSFKKLRGDDNKPLGFSGSSPKIRNHSFWSTWVYSFKNPDWLMMGLGTIITNRYISVILTIHERGRQV